MKVSPFHLGGSEMGLRLSLLGGVGLELSAARYEVGTPASPWAASSCCRWSKCP
jgi:hypothetical protein